MTPPRELDGLTGYHLRRASSVLMANLAQRLSELGLTITEASVLVVIDAHPMITQSDIGRRLAIKRANMAPLMAGLIARALVARTEAVGRTHPLKLTPTGKVHAAGALARMERHDQDFFGGLEPAEQRHLRGLLEMLWRSIPNS